MRDEKGEETGETANWGRVELNYDIGKKVFKRILHFTADVFLYKWGISDAASLRSSFRLRACSAGPELTSVSPSWTGKACRNTDHLSVDRRILWPRPTQPAGPGPFTRQQDVGGGRPRDR